MKSIELVFKHVNNKRRYVVCFSNSRFVVYDASCVKLMLEIADFTDKCLYGSGRQSSSWRYVPTVEVEDSHNVLDHRHMVTTDSLKVLVRVQIGSPQWNSLSKVLQIYSDKSWSLFFRFIHCFNIISYNFRRISCESFWKIILDNGGK